MSEFNEIYPLLNSQHQRELNDYAQFLYQKEVEEKSFDNKKFKEKLLKMSVWEEESIKMIENAGKNMKFQVATW